MVMTPPFSALFWICYVGAGVSDVLDGAAARALGQASDFGARLDSGADLIFAVSVAAVLIINVDIPVWLWICVSAVAALRLGGYVIGYCKYHAFSALHTIANKITGGAVFLLPALYAVFGVEISGIILCAVAFISASEEVIITIRSDRLSRDCKSVFSLSRTGADGQP